MSARKYSPAQGRGSVAGPSRAAMSAGSADCSVVPVTVNRAWAPGRPADDNHITHRPGHLRQAGNIPSSPESMELQSCRCPSVIVSANRPAHLRLDLRAACLLYWLSGRVPNWRSGGIREGAGGAFTGGVAVCSASAHLVIPARTCTHLHAPARLSAPASHAVAPAPRPPRRWPASGRYRRLAPRGPQRRPPDAMLAPMTAAAS